MAEHEFICDNCGRCFTRKYNLDRHIKNTCHTSVISPPTIIDCNKEVHKPKLILKTSPIVCTDVPSTHVPLQNPVHVDVISAHVPLQNPIDVNSQKKESDYNQLSKVLDEHKTQMNRIEDMLTKSMNQQPVTTNITNNTLNINCPVSITYFNQHLLNIY